MWDIGFEIREILSKSDIEIYTDSTYVDDSRHMMDMIPAGGRWNNDKRIIEIKPELVEEDLTRDPQKLTATEINVKH